MKITTWNVNGIRAWLKKDKDSWQWVQSYNPDVCCLQEVKARPEQLTEDQHALFEDYTQVWNPAQRAGYSGVLTLHKAADVDSTLGLGIEEFDSEGRVVHTHFPDFHLYNIYFPNGSRDHSRVPFKLDFYAALLEICDQHHADGEQVIICGDFNTSHQEIDLKNHKSNQKSTGFLPEERAWVTTYLEHGFKDAFRELYPDKEQYSWWAYWGKARANNVGWRLDYFLVSEGLMPRVQDVVIHDDITGSDHCPVTLLLAE